MKFNQFIIFSWSSLMISVTSIYGNQEKPPSNLQPKLKNYISPYTISEMNQKIKNCNSLMNQTKQTAEKAYDDSRLTENQRQSFISQGAQYITHAKEIDSYHQKKFNEIKMRQGQNESLDDEAYQLMIDYSDACKKNISDYIAFIKYIKQAIDKNVLWKSAAPQKRTITIGSQRLSQN